MVHLRMKAMKVVILIFVVALFGFIGRPAHATVIYDLTAACSGDCGPLGVLTTTVGAVSGSITLSIPDSPIAQNWNSSNVQSYSFTFGSFQISSANSTLSDSVVGTNPFTTTATTPFSHSDGFLIARYTLDTTVFLNITLGGLNLVQGGLASCSGSCQAQALGPWSRESAPVPEPATILLFGSGLAGLVLMRKKLTV